MIWPKVPVLAATITDGDALSSRGEKVPVVSPQKHLKMPSGFLKDIQGCDSSLVGCNNATQLPSPPPDAKKGDNKNIM